MEAIGLYETEQRVRVLCEARLHWVTGLCRLVAVNVSG